VPLIDSADVDFELVDGRARIGLVERYDAAC